VLGVGEGELLEEGPVNEIGGGVATDVAFGGIVGLRAVFSDPIVGVMKVQDAAAVGLNGDSAIIQPNFARMNYVLWLLGEGGCEGQDEQ